MSKYRVKIGIHSFGNLTVRKGDVFEQENEQFADTAGRGRFFEKVLEKDQKTIVQIAEDAKKSSSEQVVELKNEKIPSLGPIGAIGPDGIQGETLPPANVNVPKKNKAGRPKKNTVSK